MASQSPFHQLGAPTSVAETPPDALARLDVAVPRGAVVVAGDVVGDDEGGVVGPLVLVGVVLLDGADGSTAPAWAPARSVTVAVATSATTARIRVARRGPRTLSYRSPRGPD